MGAREKRWHRSMGVRPTWLALAVCLFLVTGCTHTALDLAPPTPQSPAVSAGGSTASSRIGGPDFAVSPDPTLPDMRARPQIDQAHAYALPELIDIAQMNNPVTRTSWIRARQAAIAVGATKATYLPTLSAEILVGYARTSRPVSGLHAGLIDIPAGTLSAEGTQVIPALTAKWLLFDFGARKAARETAEQLSFAANVSFNGAHQKLIHDVAVAYYGLAGARAQLAIADDAVANSKTVLKQAEARFERGLATVVAVAQARQLVAQAEFDRTQSVGAERSAYQLLLAAMGISPATQIKVRGVSGRSLPRSIPKDIDRLIRVSIQRRPDIQAAFARVQAEKRGVDEAKAAFLPKIAVIGSLSQNIGRLRVSDTRFADSSTVDVNQPNMSVMLGVTVPLFDGGLRDSRLQAAKADVVAAQQELAGLQSVAASEIVLAYELLRTSLASYAAASELARAAKVTRDATLARYRSGLVTVAEVSAALTALLKARSAKAQAYSSALIAAASLAFSTGVMTNRLSPLEHYRAGSN